MWEDLKVAIQRLREENITDGGAEVLGTGMSEDGEVAAGIEMDLGDTDTIIARIDGEIVTLTEELAAARDRDPGIGMNIVREMTTGEIITEKDNP